MIGEVFLYGVGHFNVKLHDYCKGNRTMTKIDFYELANGKKDDEEFQKWWESKKIIKWESQRKGFFGTVVMIVEYDE